MPWLRSESLVDLGLLQHDDLFLAALPCGVLLAGFGAREWIRSWRENVQLPERRFRDGDMRAYRFAAYNEDLVTVPALCKRPIFFGALFDSSQFTLGEKVWRLVCHRPERRVVILVSISCQV